MTNEDCARIAAECWQLLATGARDRQSPMHVPVVASIAANGTPDQRVMVLRAADAEMASLRFNTDARSPKLAQIASNPAVHVLAYDPVAKVQLRLSGTGSVDATGVQTEAAWAAATLFARRCYLATVAPGTISSSATSGLPAAMEGIKPSADEIAWGRPNFATLSVAVDLIDWLYLANSGHRRAQLTRTSAGWHGEWLVP